MSELRLLGEMSQRSRVLLRRMVPLLLLGTTCSSLSIGLVAHASMPDFYESSLSLRKIRCKYPKS